MARPLPREHQPAGALEGKRSPPLRRRGLRRLTCGAVPVARTSNDRRKGMGLIMPFLIGAAPAAYALNREAAGAVENIRNKMFMISESIHVPRTQNVAFPEGQAAALKTCRRRRCTTARRSYPPRSRFRRPS